MQLTKLESVVRSIIADCTGYDLTKGEDDDGVYYNLIDNYGDVDGDAFYEFEDVLDYVCLNDQVEAEINKLFIVTA